MQVGRYYVRAARKAFPFAHYLVEFGPRVLLLKQGRGVRLDEAQAMCYNYDA